MTRHLTTKELDWAQALFAKGWDLTRIRDALQKKRHGEPTPTVDNLRHALAGRTHRRSGPERRGRPKKITRIKLRALDKARKALQKESKGMREVTLQMVKKRARVKADDTTVARALKADLGIQWRSPREKPQRTPQQDEARMAWCSTRMHLKEEYWLSKVHMYIDCKKFQLPLHTRHRQVKASLKVRGVLRKRSEGLVRHLTKPSPTRHRATSGAPAWVLAGVMGDRIRVWHYISTRWNAKTAAEAYSGPIANALRAHHPGARKWRILEDNDPAGFKSRAAQNVKEELGIEELSLPPYSPDLQPLDYSLWRAVEERAAKAIGDRTVSADQYRKTLRLAALRLPAEVVRAAVADMPQRIKMIFEAKGGHIAKD